MSTHSADLKLEISPQARFEAVDVRRRVLEMHGTILEQFPRMLYCSYHTTAGYLDQRLVSRLNARRDGVMSYLCAFRTIFLEGAGYQHDQLHLRQELSEEQRRIEPRNGDSHLAFISAGLRTCVTYRHRPGEPVLFIDLDGVNGAWPRRRVTSILGFTDEKVVARERVKIPISARSVDSVNLKDPSLGLFDRLEVLINRHGVVKGRIRLALAEDEREAALTVNEYETLLMQRDLPDIILNPFRFIIDWPYRRLARLRHIGMKTMTCARFLRLQRSVSLLVSDCGTNGCGRLIQGRYQSPILVQWGSDAGRTRDIDVYVTQFH
jgi:hypothetical protein